MSRQDISIHIRQSAKKADIKTPPPCGGEAHPLD